MARIKQEGPLTTVCYLDCNPVHPIKDASPGTLAVSADDQQVDERMQEGGFVRMVWWSRPDTGMGLTLWRKPGLAMPRRRILISGPSWGDVCDKAGTYSECDEFFSCCGTKLADRYRCHMHEDFATLTLSPKAPPHHKKAAPAIRIWEGKFKSVRHDYEEKPKVIFNRRVRCWIRLPYGCKYEMGDIRLI